MKQQTIDNTLAALKEYQGLIASGLFNGTERQKIDKKFSVPFIVFSQAVRQGIFKRVDRGVYSVLIHKIEPIHARRLLEEVYKNQAEANKRHRIKNKEASPIQPVKTEKLKKPSKKVAEVSGAISWEEATSQANASLSAELMAGKRHGYNVTDVMQYLQRNFNLILK